MINLITTLDYKAALREGEERLACKYVLVRDRAGVHLVVGLRRDYPYHASLVDRYCRLKGMPCFWAQKPDVLTIVDAAHRVEGGGWLEICPARREAVFYGSSKAYGVCPGGLLKEVLDITGFLGDYSVTTRR